KPVKNINLAVTIDNPDGVPDHTMVNIPAAHIELDNDPFDFRLLVKNPISNVYIDAAAKGKLDLSKIAQLIKFETGTTLTGLLNADVTIKGTVNDIQNQQYDQFNASGNIDLNNFFYASKDYPDGVKLDLLQSSFNPRNILLQNVSGQYLHSSFTANGQINNLLSYILKNKPLDGLLTVNADKINLNDWMGVSTDTLTKGTEISKPFVVPATIRLIINATAGEVRYDKLDIKNLSGSLQISDETVLLKNIKGNALDGTMNINGTYSTAESKKNPHISLTYDVKDMDIEKTFYAFNTIHKLMPIGQFIAGKLNSQLSMNGKLGENMMPDLNSLTGKGDLFLIEGFLSKFKPLEEIAQTINVKELAQISIREVKNYIEFTDGKVMVKPFKLKVKDIDMEIGGFHGFDQSLDYTINLRVPRSLMGEKGNVFVNNLVTQINNKGLPIKVGDIVPIQIKLGGFIKSPQLKTDLKQTASDLSEDLKKQVIDFAKEKIDSTKIAVTKAVKDSVESAKKQVVKAAEEEIKKKLFGTKDSVSKSASDTISARKKLEETGKGLIKDIFKRKKKDTAKTGG
ncbi:MAG: AsmA-like C-terminal region-containing protein, partial [Chitinophagaceae bacterium]